MTTSIAQIDLVVSGTELWAITPTLPVWDFYDVSKQLPAAYAGYELDHYVPIADDTGRHFDGWVLRPSLALAQG